MKKVVLYCDRCNAEHKETPASTVVWIRTAGMPRVARFDVCAEHHQLIVGAMGSMSPNGASAPKVAGAVSLKDRIPERANWGSKSKVYQGVYDKLVPYIAKTPAFSTDDLQAFFDGKVKPGTYLPALSRLIAEGRITRPVQGFYVRSGHTFPAPATDEDAIAVLLKIIRAQPGIRSSFAMVKAGIKYDSRWKRLRELLRDKGMRTKGTKSMMQLYPPKG
jgi:hypothetical protein